MAGEPYDFETGVGAPRRSGIGAGDRNKIQSYDLEPTTPLHGAEQKYSR